MAPTADLTKLVVPSDRKANADCALLALLGRDVALKQGSFSKKWQKFDDRISGSKVGKALTSGVDRVVQTAPLSGRDGEVDFSALGASQRSSPARLFGRLR